METKGRSYINNEFDKGFLLSDENIVKLCDIVRKRIKENNIEGELGWKVVRSDSLIYETYNSSDILNEENSKRNLITTLRLFHNSDRLQFNLTFDKKEGGALFIESADRDLALLLKSDIKEYLQTEVLIFRKFNFSDSKFERLMLLLVPVTMLGFTLYAASSIEDSSKILESTDVIEKINYLIKRNNYTSGKITYWVFGGMILLAILGSFWGSILDEIYPRNIFCLGKEKTRYNRICETRSRWIWGIGIAFLISCVSGYAVWLATK